MPKYSNTAMSVREAGRKGGQMTKRRHGPEFYEEIGRKGGETTSREHGPEFYAKIGRQGGSARGKRKRSA